MNKKENSIILSADQTDALDKLKDFLLTKDTSITLIGYAGTGKTTILQDFVYQLESMRYEFVLCAPTHRAKLVLSQSTNREAITLHKLLSLAPNIEIYNLDYKDLMFHSKGSSQIPHDGIVIIDEASMVNDHIYRLLHKYAEENNSKLIFVGDRSQLAPINEKESKVFNNKHKITLSKIHRQAENNPILPILNELRNHHKLKFYDIPEYLYTYTNAEEFITKSIPYFYHALKNSNTNDVKILSYTNARVKAFNDCIRRVLFKEKAENPYNKLEILTGYENFEYNNHTYYNSMDYIIISVEKYSKYIPKFMALPGYKLELYDPYADSTNEIFILDNNINPDHLTLLATLIEETRFKALDAKRKNQRIIANKKWKEYFEILNSFAISFNLVYDNRVIKNKTFDYGYAMTVFKAQGSSIENVFIDIKDINKCKDDNTKRQMQYVGLSRTKNKIFLLQ